MRTDAQPIRIALFAPDGRMGKAIAEAVEQEPGFALDQDNGDVLVDFSAPDALQASLDRAVSAGIPVLVGTTGLGPDADALIEEAAKQIAVLRAANTSLGVALLSELVERAAHVLASDNWDIEIVETHHGAKIDAPSGTALQLGHAAVRGRGETENFEIGMRGGCVPRVIGAIGFSSVRGGTVAGEHDVMFLGPEERLVLSHRAENRSIFARGALAAARFLHGQPAGLYSMRDVIGSQGTHA